MENDKRFAHIATDPKFRRIPKNERKIKIDKRFQSMFKDKKFQVKYTVDKRGRPVNYSTTEDLKRYYELSSGEDNSEEENEDSESEELNEDSHETKVINADSEEESEDTDEESAESIDEDEGSTDSDAKKSSNKKNEKRTVKTAKAQVKTAKKKKEKKKQKIPSEGSEISIKNISDKQIPKKIKNRLKNLDIDYARGEGVLLSDSSSDDEESEEEASETDDIDHKWGELDTDAVKADDITHRLAACNMDWDRIRATDIMMLCNSFVPAGGTIISVHIYPSEFGKQRMAEEETKGPIELVDAQHGDDDDDNEDGARYHMEKLRQYQLNRLKYYYAVITCDSANTANKIYSECDGMEYESSATKVDLRFIPDDMVFDDDPKEICDKIPEINKYQPRFFTTTALQQAKVDLTWDETNPERQEINEKLQSGKVDEISEHDLQAYLASSSGEEDDESDQNSVINDDENDNPIDKYKALLSEIENKEKEKDKKDVQMEISWGIDLEKKTEKFVEEKRALSENKTPFQQYLDKRKEKRKEKRTQRKTNEDDEMDAPSDVDMNDPYFAEEFSKAEFKNKKKQRDSDDSDDAEDAKQRQAELELLLHNDDDDNKKHFSLKKIQDQECESKTKKKKNKNTKIANDDDFNINVNDDRFSALFTSHHYNIDPTDPHYKKTKGMETLIGEKIKRRVDADEEITAKKPKVGNGSKKSKHAELSVLVKSVKRKTQSYKNK